MGVFKEEILKRLDIRAPIKMPHSFVGSPVREYHIPYLEMSESLQSTLDYESKLDRGPENLLPMIADGEKQAAAFLAERIAAQ
jgi:NTE family protein